MMEFRINRSLIWCLASFIMGIMPIRNAFSGNLRILVHIRGVAETNISLIPLSGARQLKTIRELKSVKPGQQAEMVIPDGFAPGEFILRFDYREKPESTPYPSEKYILIGNQSFDLWVHPMFANHPDSTWFGNGEMENAAFTRFSKENSVRKEKISLLQQFLMEYDDVGSEFYREGIREFEKRRQNYNQWIDDKVRDDKALFASSLYRFSFLPDVDWTGSEKDRLLSLIGHYFDGIDFNDPVITRTSQLNEWMNSYVNLHGQMATSISLRDSLIPAAARKAIEKARLGHPQVYGWMVDYFFRGFESNNLPGGMKVLESYLNDPDCLTTKRMEIERRLKGMETLRPGVQAPDFELKTSANLPFRLSDFIPGEGYILLFFWSADCSHCEETEKSLYPWSVRPDISSRLSVAAISLDETETEINAWNRKIPGLKGWEHLRAPEGINSKVANDYFILATPVMILVDRNTGKIASMPESTEALIRLFR